MDLDPRDSKIAKPTPPALPKPAAQEVVESPRERQARLFQDALKPNSARGSAERAQADIDRVFGREALSPEGGPQAALWAAVDRLRTAPARQGESLAPRFESIPVRLALVQGDRAAQDAVLLERLADRGERSLREDGPSAGVRDELLSEVQRAEDEGLVSHEDAAARRGEILDLYSREVARVGEAIRQADLRNRSLADQVTQGELALSDGGAVALARGQALDRVVEDHFREVLSRVTPAAGAAQLQAEFEAQLLACAPPGGVSTDLSRDQELLLGARAAARSQAMKMLYTLDGIRLSNDPQDPARLAYDLAKVEYLRARDLAGLVPQEGAEPSRGEEGARLVLRRIQGEPEAAFEKIQEQVEAQYAALWELQTSGQVDQETVELVSEHLVDAEVAQTEVVLALAAHDQALLNYLQASEVYLRQYEARVPAGLPLPEGVERRIPTAAEVHEARMALLAARASGTEARVLEHARANSEKAFQDQAVAFMDRHLPLLEVPDNLPDLDILKVQASVVSGNMGTAEAWQRLSEVEVRDLRERAQRMRAYASVIQNSVVGKTTGYVTHMGVVTAEHAAAMAWVIAQSLAKTTTAHLTDLGKAIGKGQDAQAGIQAAMELFTVGGTSFGQAWAGLKLAKAVRNQRVQINMQRKQEVRERLENRRRELQEMVKDNRDGAERLASYLDQTKQLRDQIKGVITAEPVNRQQALALALSTMESMQGKLQLMRPDHEDVYQQIQKSTDLSITALRAKAARALAAHGLEAEGAAFDEEEAHRIHQASNLRGVNVHQAVDAAAHLRDLVTAKDRSLEPLNEELRQLISEKGFGSHGNLAGGLMLMGTDRGPMGVLLHPGNPPGVALVPVKISENGEFHGFEGKPAVFDLADSAQARGGVNVEGFHDLPVKVQLEEFPRWAAAMGVDQVKIQAIKDYLGACVDHKGLPLQTSLPQSMEHLHALKASGILTVPTAIDDHSLMPADAGLEAYWESYAGRGVDTAKMQAAIETSALGAWDQAIARQSVVAAVMTRWREQESRKASV